MSVSKKTEENRTSVAATGTAADSSPIPLDGVPNLSYDNATNRITTTGYEYDAAGNQIKAPDASGNGLLLEYDAANRIHIIKKESDSSYVQAFQYGSTNARVMDMDYNFGYLKIFASVGGTTMAEYTEFTHTVPTWMKTYTYFGDTQLATVTPNGTGGEFTEFNHPDRLGTRLMTNQTGGTAYEQVTLPFGTALNAESSVTTNNRRFTSYDRSNATGFDYAINRTYDPKQGRFTTVDPIGMSAVSLASPQTLNMYTYCGNDPINFTDPSGLFFGKLFKWIGKIFNAIMTVLKWVVVAIIVVAVAIAVFKSGGAAIGFLNSILGLVGKLLGVSMVEAPMILEFGGVLIEVTVQQLSISLTTQMIAGAFAVGAISSSFAQTKDAKKRGVIIDQTVARVIARLKGNPKCLKTINHDNYDLSPAEALATISAPGGTGAIVYTGSLETPAQTVPNQTSSGVIELGPSFFKTKIKDARGNDWNKITGMNTLRTREFIMLHELRHLFGSDHGYEGGIEEDVTKILKDCFGVTPDLSGGIK